MASPLTFSHAPMSVTILISSESGWPSRWSGTLNMRLPFLLTMSASIGMTVEAGT